MLREGTKGNTSGTKMATREKAADACGFVDCPQCHQKPVNNQKPVNTKFPTEVVSLQGILSPLRSGHEGTFLAFQLAFCRKSLPLFPYLYSPSRILSLSFSFRESTLEWTRRHLPAFSSCLLSSSVPSFPNSAIVSCLLLSSPLFPTLLSCHVTF
eukprot:g69321.t1